jgi:hypothetical protein
MGGECGKYGGEEVGVQDLMEKSEGKRPLVRPRCRLDHRRNLGGTRGKRLSNIFLPENSFLGYYLKRGK